MHTFLDRIFTIYWSHHHIHWKLHHSCVHDAGTGSTTDWRGGSEQPCRYSATLPVVSGLHHHIAGTSQAGTGPQQAVTIHCQVSQLPMIGTYRYSSGDWCEIMNPFLLTDILRCTSCVWGLLDFHQIFSFQILFFA